MPRPSSKRGKGRVGKAYLRRAAALRAKGLPCSLCGLPIDYHAAPRTRWSFSVDHVIPLNHHGAELDWSNLQPAHYGCNSRKRDRVGAATPLPPVTSRTW